MFDISKIFLMILIVAVIFLSLFIYFVFFIPNNFDEPKGKIVTISKGTSFHAIVDSLYDNGTIRSKWTFKLAGRILNYTKSIKIGKYLLVSGLSNIEILENISTGKSQLIIPVTIPEGWRMEKIARRIERDLGVDSKKILELCMNEKFISEQKINAKTLEGYLLPDTYAFYWQTDEEEIIARILNAFKQFYNDSLKRKQEMLKMNQKEVLTFASIVEAESSIDYERPIIAGVYWNRLKKRMRLEADPTIQYALGESRRLTYKDLEIDSPYNTYRRFGLPPGPINNPGKAAILATLYPQEHEYLFFVATGTGGHRFAKNYIEHQHNSRKYFKTRRELAKQARLNKEQFSK